MSGEKPRAGGYAMCLLLKNNLLSVKSTPMIESTITVRGKQGDASLEENSSAENSKGS